MNCSGRWEYFDVKLKDYDRLVVAGCMSWSCLCKGQTLEW